MNKAVNLITVPYDSAHFNKRMGSGPLHVVNNGLIQNLLHAGYIVSHKEIKVEENFPTEISSTVKLLHHIKSSVAHSIQSQSFPIVLSGNCSATVGSVAAHDENHIGVLWFDAHGDYETPDTTVSGFLDGMALAMLTGSCWRNLLSPIIKIPVAGSHIILIGARDLSTFEKESISSNKINHISVEQIRHKQEIIKQACEEFKRRGVKKLHIHVDVDVIDPSIARANSYAVDNGLSKKELIQMINHCISQISVVSATISSYDPSFDTDGRMLSIINELIETILKGYFSE